MKTNILIVALPEYVNAEEVIKQIGELLQGPDQVSAIFVTPSDLMSLSDAVRPIATKRTRKQSRFEEAVIGIIDAIPDHEVDCPAFRATFHELSLKGTIDKIVLETIAMGPKSKSDFEFLHKNNAEGIVTLAQTALAMINSIGE